jgi:hypothetical protein
MVLLLFIIAVAIAAAGQYLVPHSVRTRAVRSLAALVNGGDMAGQKSTRCRDVRFLPKGAEKRTALRRGGDPVPVQITANPDGSAPSEAMVLDRSRGGMLLAVSEETPRGAIRYVLPPHAPADLEWVGLEVRHCRFRDGKWLLGCKFTKELTWNVLLMFG